MIVKILISPALSISDQMYEYDTYKLILLLPGPWHKELLEHLGPDTSKVDFQN